MNCEVILTEPVAGLGAEADVVKVKAGFARNYLIPKGMAYEVSPATLRRINLLRAKRAEREARELNDSQELARKINKVKMTMVLETGEGGKAFGSITSSDIALRLKTDLGIEIDRHRIDLERPIKETGPHEVPIKLHADVTAKLALTVKSAKPEEEAPAEEGAARGDKGDTGEKGYRARPKARHTK
jgi:large subunit ribosomal protein L9